MLKEHFNRQSKRCKPGVNTQLHLKSLSSGFPPTPPPPGLCGRHDLSAASLCCRAGTAEAAAPNRAVPVAGPLYVVTATCDLLPAAAAPVCRVSVLRAGVICVLGVRPGARVWVSRGYGGYWEPYKRMRSSFANGLSDRQGVWLMDPGKGGIKVCLCRLLSTSTDVRYR